MRVDYFLEMSGKHGWRINGCVAKQLRMLFLGRGYPLGGKTECRLSGLDTLNRLAGWKVSVVAMNGMTFELDTPHGRMMATMLAGIAQFERDLLSERVKSGLAAARARGKKLGRQPGQRPKSDKLAPKVLQAIEDGRSYRWIARDLGISKNTVTDIVRRHRHNAL